MCGRYVLADDKDNFEIQRVIEVISAGYDRLRTGDIYPTNEAPILSVIDGRPGLSLMRWGFPRWDGRGVVINAKSETAREKRMFSKPLAETRCAVISTGFYEWQAVNEREKTKYLFNEPSSPNLYMAGIYQLFADGERFVILTTAANATMEDIHHRMPVILYKNELKKWLFDDNYMKYLFSRDSVILKRALVL